MQFTITLNAAPDRVELEIGDAGIGFDLDKVMNGRVLGLVSMQERVHVVKRQLLIDSKPNRGTRIRASVPLVAEPGAKTIAAGTA
jgi:signal transduction histidine kinase